TSRALVRRAAVGAPADSPPREPGPCRRLAEPIAPARRTERVSLGQAAAYALANGEVVVRSIDDGHLAIDNDGDGQGVRAIVGWRKNWLFAGSDNGGQAAAILFSLSTCGERHENKPFADLRDYSGDCPPRVQLGSPKSSLTPG